MWWPPRRGLGLPRAPATPAHSPTTAFVPRACPGERQPLPPPSTPERPVPALAVSAEARGGSHDSRISLRAQLGEHSTFLPAPPGRAGAGLMSIMLIMVQLLRGWGARANTPPPPPPTSLIVKETGI